MLIVQIFYTAYISFTRWVTLNFPIKGYMFLELTFWYVNGLALLIGCFVLLQFEVSKLPYKLDTLVMSYSDNQLIGYIGFDVLINFNQPMFLIVSILAAILTIPALLTNIMTLIKLKQFQKKAVISTENKHSKRASQIRMVLYVLIMSINQFIFMGTRVVIFINPKINGCDQSVLMMFYGIRPYIMHLVCLTSPYALIILNKSLRKRIINSLPFLPFLGKFISKNTFKTTVTRIAIKSGRTSKIVKNSNW
uniref:Serpentine receptor class gamma n=1 Tax=Parastrongyloides trichosuri TaxID=131310 RepID=A0A0N4Z5Z5_PARTI